MATISLPSTNCDECGTRVVLESCDWEMDGGECGKCGAYVTRYTAEFRESCDWL